MVCATFAKPLVRTTGQCGGIPKVQGLMNYGQIVPQNASSQSKMSQSHIRNDFTHFEYGFGIFVIGVKRFEALSVHSPLILALWGTPAVTLGNRRAGETYYSQTVKPQKCSDFIDWPMVLPVSICKFDANNTPDAFKHVPDFF